MSKERSMRRFRVLLNGAWAIVALAAAACAHAAYPDRPIHVIVPYPAGSTADIMIRTISPQLGEELGQPLIIENRAGGSGITAARFVAKSASDGYTLLFDGINHVTNVGLFDRLPYTVGKDFTPVSYVGNVQTVLLANPKTGFQSVADLVQAAKAQPGVLNFGSAGNGTAGHLSTELLSRATGISLMHIPYKGASPALVDLIGGQVQVLFTGLPPTVSIVQAGQANALVVSGAKRSPLLPDVPSMGELGLLEQDVEIWFGLLAPAGTLDSVVDRLSRAVSQVSNQPKVVRLLVEQGVTTVASTPDQFATVIERDLKRWPPLIRSLGIEPQ
ncbi:MAG: tripartite tricarboxylate transporter substrate binding protein [Pusillimonas sp.]